MYMTLSETAIAGPPLLVETIIKHFDAIKTDPWLPRHLGYLLGLPAVLFFTNFTFRRYIRAFTEANVLQRSRLMSEFVQKWFRISPSVKHDISRGNVQNLLNVDVPAVSQCVERYVDALMVVIDLTVATVLLWRYFGITTLVSLILMGLSLPLVKNLIRDTRRRQQEMLEARDARIDLFSQICSAIKVIKLSGWSDVFLNRTRATRESEIARILRLMVLRTRSTLVFSSAGLVVATATYGIHLLRGGSLDAALSVPHSPCLPKP